MSNHMLSPAEIENYHRDGYLLKDSLFDNDIIKSIHTEMDRILCEDSPRKILEKNGLVRSLFAPEQSSELFSKLVKYKPLVNIATQLIGEDVYIHQTKLNTKHALQGDLWPWHQDYVFWLKDDGMPKPDVVTAMVFINEITEFNGPLLLIPGSHKEGVIDVKNEMHGKNNSSVPNYMSALTADLKYSLERTSISKMAEENGIFSAKGLPGSVLFFHGNVFHASSYNLSPWDRHTFFITYNSINNTLRDTDTPRPEFLANRKYTPLKEVAVDLLM